jgi:hypothetical protein
MSYFVELDFPVKPATEPPTVTTVKYGEVGLNTDTGNVLAYIKSVSEIYRVVNENRSFENSAATIVFQNLNGHFNKLMNSDDKYIKGIVCRISDNDTLIFTGKVYTLPNCDPKEFIIVADSKTDGINDEINKVITLTEFPNCPVFNVGKYSNIVFGEASDYGGNNTGMLTAYQVDNNRFLAAWHHLHGFNGGNVRVYKPDGTHITPVCTFDNNIDGNAYILYTPPIDGELYFDTDGFIDDGDVYITNPAWQLWHMNNKFGKFVIRGTSAASIIYDGRGYDTSSIVINDATTWGQFFERFCINFDCYIYHLVTGRIKIKVLTWGEDAAEFTINPHYVDSLETFKNRQDMSEIINEYKRMYWYHFRLNFFHRLPSDVDSDTEWQAEKGNLDLRYLNDETISKDVAERHLYFQEKPITYYRFRLPKIIADPLDLINQIKIKFQTGYNSYVWRLILIIKKINLPDSNLIGFEAMDITGIDGGLIRLWEENNPDIVLLRSDSDPKCHILT